MVVPRIVRPRAGCRVVWIRLAEQRGADRGDFTVEAVFALVVGFGDAGGDAVEADAEQGLGGLSPGLDRRFVVEREFREPVDRVDPQPRQGQLGLNIGEQPHPGDRPAGVE
ncbi:MAG: hypothetical protein AAF593_02505 [Planctomycetota bacterium]